MRVTLLILSISLVCGLPAAAQKEISIPVPTISKKHNHIVSFKCAGQPDKIMAHRNNPFFACIGGRVTCSRAGNIPSWMIEESRREYDRNRQEYESKYGGRVTYLSWRSEEQARRRARGDSTRVTREHYNAYLASSGLGTSTHTTRATASAPARRVTSTPRPPPQEAPVEPDKVRQVAVGNSTAEVIALLGQPKWRLAAGSETWTYSLTTGQSARLRFTGGKVASVMVP